jgi:amino acid adenylation domain-containing protein
MSSLKDSLTVHEQEHNAFLREQWDVLDHFPLSFAQQRIWFLEELNPGLPTYNMSVSVDVHGRLSIPALKAAFRRLMGRHESLRTSFRVREGQPVQIVWAEEEVQIPFLLVDLRELGAECESDPRDTASAQKVETQRLTAREFAEPFHLADAPLLRVQLLWLGTNAYKMLLTMHHIVSDGWSMSVLVRDLGRLYEAELSGSLAVLPDLPIQYADYAVWQRQRIAAGLLDEQLEYWKKKLAGLPALELPTDHARSASSSQRGARTRVEIGPELTARINSTSREESLTVHMLLLAAWATLLGRYSRQNDLAIGTPVANRVDGQTDHLIGFFVNMLMLRSHLSGHLTVRELLRQIKSTALEAYDHQELPFDRLVEELQPKRHGSETPLAQAAFVLQNIHVPELSAGGLQLRAETRHTTTAKFHLLLDLFEEDGKMAGTLEYATDLFESATAERLARLYKRVLEQIVDSPSRRLDEIHLLTQEEEEHLLAAWPFVPVAGEGVGLHEAFREQALLKPDAIALSWEEQHLSYAELNRRASRLAHYLHKLGVTAGTLTGICLDRTPEFVIAILAVLKAGSAYVPLDPAYPVERLKFMIEDAGMSAIILQESIAEKLEAGPHMVCLERDQMLIERESEAEFPATGTDPNELAYVIYTSGSTGRPKGVMVTHHNAWRLLKTTEPLFEFGADDVWSLFHSFAFDFSVWEMWGALLHGGRLALASYWTARSFDDFHQLLEAEQVTVLNQTPSAFRQLMQVSLAEVRPAGALRYVIFGGEALDMASLHPWFMRCGEDWPALINMYGITETTVHVSFRRIRAADCAGGKSLIGPPIPDLQMYLLDDCMQIVPAGMPGEPYVSGDGLARGYLNRPELTAEKFLPDPFSGKPGARTYRSGDLARRTVDGDVEYLGRVDEQVKIRGFRIELGEIEAVLRQHAKVREGAVVAFQDAQLGTRLAAYVAPRGLAEDETIHEIRQWGVERWQTVFDTVYNKSNTPGDSSFNVAGWNSSYTQQPIAAEEMREWVERTVERILSLRPRRVLEIGCGTGLLLSRILPHCERYHGRDVSGTAIRQLTKSGILEKYPQLTLTQAAADDFSGLEGDKFDTVIMNSTVQYFPDAAYFEKVLEGVLPHVDEGGNFFLGDLRNLDWLEAFHFSLELYKSGPDHDKAELQRRAVHSARNEAELAISPKFFHAFQVKHPGTRSVQSLLKRAVFANEMTCFRYDVVLHVGRAEMPKLDYEVIDWEQEDLTVESLQRALQSCDRDALLITGIRNSRVCEEMETLRALGAAETSLAGDRKKGVDPERLCALGESLGFTPMPLLPPEPPERYQVLYWKRRQDAELWTMPEQKPLSIKEEPSRYTNAPVSPPDDLIPELREYLQEKLPDYMVPSQFILLWSLPLTVNGKVDRRALPHPGEISAELAEGHVEAQTATEKQLVTIWEDVLRLTGVGTNHNFFTDLGGHSLLATQVIARIRSACQVELPLQAIFEHPRIAALAHEVERVRARPNVKRVAPPLVRAARGEEIPLSFAQQRLWFLDQLTPNAATYNVPACLSLHGKLDAEALEQALRILVERHEILRTTFAAMQGRPVQRIGAVPERLLQVIDLRELPEQERDARAVELAVKEANTPFNLRSGPLLRCTLVGVREREHLLLLTMHHIVSDGFSIDVIASEMAEVYTALRQKRAPHLQELPVQYADYAIWQRLWMQGETLGEHVEYWRKALADLEQLELPTDFSRSRHNGREESKFVHFEICETLTAGIRELCDRSSVTTFVVLLAALQLLLSRWSDQDDVAVGAVIANRTRTEIEGLVGFFVNTLVLRANLARPQTFAELLCQVSETVLGAYAHQELPFETIVEELRPERVAGRNPFFQVMLALQNVRGLKLDLPGLTVQERPDILRRPGKFEMSWEFREDAGRIWGNVEYAPGLFAASTVARMTESFLLILEQMASHPEQRLSETFLDRDAVP